MIRRCAEKSVALGTNLILRFTQPGDKVMDMFAGTASLALAAMMTSRIYCGTDEDHDVVDPARARIGRLLLSKERLNDLPRLTADLTGGLVRLASAPATCPIIGKNNIPLGVAGTIHTRKHTHAHTYRPDRTTDTLEKELARVHGKIMVIKKTEQQGRKGEDMGEGVFAAEKVPAGTRLG